MAIGVPGWPEFAFCTASMHSVRIVFTARTSMGLPPTAPRARSSSASRDGVATVVIASSRPAGRRPWTRSSSSHPPIRLLVCSSPGFPVYDLDQLREVLLAELSDHDQLGHRHVAHERLRQVRHLGRLAALRVG